jgi:hypothetical protein
MAGAVVALHHFVGFARRRPASFLIVGCLAAGPAVGAWSCIVVCLRFRLLECLDCAEATFWATTAFDNKWIEPPHPIQAPA